MKPIENWLQHKFESSSALTPEFAAFYRNIKSYLKKQLAPEFNFTVSRGHFEFSGFAQNKATGLWAYFSASDIRYWPDGWYHNLLIRTAKHGKDYRGGCNQETSLNSLKEKLLEITI